MTTEFSQKLLLLVLDFELSALSFDLSAFTFQL